MSGVPPTNTDLLLAALVTAGIKTAQEFQALEDRHEILEPAVKKAVAQLKILAKSLAKRPFQPWKAHYIEGINKIAHDLEVAV